MATDTIRTLLALAFPGADIAVDDRTGGGDHLQVAAVSSAFDGLSLIEQHKLLPCRPPRRRWASTSTSSRSRLSTVLGGLDCGKDGLLKAAKGSGSLCALARFAQDGFSSAAQTR
jgi:hypothetical protein